MRLSVHVELPDKSKPEPWNGKAGRKCLPQPSLVSPPRAYWRMHDGRECLADTFSPQHTHRVDVIIKIGPIE